MSKLFYQPICAQEYGKNNPSNNKLCSWIAKGMRTKNYHLFQDGPALILYGQSILDAKSKDLLITRWPEELKPQNYEYNLAKIILDQPKWVLYLYACSNVIVKPSVSSIYGLQKWQWRY